MRYFALVLTLFKISVCFGQIPEHASTIRAPSFPLAVRTPYASIWLPADELPGNWPTFWTGHPKGWLGVVRVDGMSYEWMGAVSTQADTPIPTRAIQNSVHTTPTRTIFSLTAGPVNLNVTFFSPVEFEDVEKQSIPLSYVFVTVAPNDGLSHNVQIYVDITGEWATSDHSKIVTWDISQSSSLKTWTTQLQDQIPFAEFWDYPTWGQAVFTTTASATHASGSDREIRRAFAESGMLNNTNDENFRCASCDWPTFAFVHDLGQISSPSETLQFTVGHIREFNINLMNVGQRALWTEYFNSTAEMIDFFYNDVENALAVAEALDVKVLNDAYAAEGQAYADIVALSLRQAYAGTEFSGNKTFPILYLKEISSNGNMQTVDVMYPAAPLFYYLNVKYLQYYLEPLFYQMESDLWTKRWAMHDIGANFPNASGMGYGEDMPVEETGNMILMIADIALHPSTPTDEAIEYVRKHWTILVKWADYLYYHCLYPVNQLTTDDFTGRTQLNSGLALKGILGIKAFAKLAALIGEEPAAEFYNNATTSYIQTWILESINDDGTHLKREYNVTDGYQFKYNAFHDKLLSLNAVPEEIYQLEAAFYLTTEEPYGFPFVSTHDYTKSDWEVWTAAAFGEANPTLRTNTVQAMSRYLQDTPSRVPFCDWYFTATSHQTGFQARPVAGGHFAILALNNPAAP